MTIYLGADHRGFALRDAIRKALEADGRTVVDLGNHVVDHDDDYADFAKAVALKVGEHPSDDRGIVICGSGIGVDVVANKFKGIRSALAMSPEHVAAGRRDDDVNVLALAADFTDEPTALATAKAFLETPFDPQERYVRRIEKIAADER
ncbi:MAG TPA: RpiB/LacA/LacB family sugar-phosphate isomerase [Candidatus Paceibacterota bacterium]|nr:RpiB/LacA/LacB family sugar-phosphate isomerase [Candidatus Paceibacterota bacterium]